MTAAEYARLARPFNRSTLNEARRRAAMYRIVIERDDDAGGYIGSTVEMPTVMGGGATVEACVRDVLGATAASIATMLECDVTPPAPAREGKRDQQVNIRLTAEERLALDEAARRDGFRSISEFMRNAALRQSP
jgi:predicted RNase H-like HicB family nuclease